MIEVAAEQVQDRGQPAGPSQGTGGNARTHLSLEQSRALAVTGASVALSAGAGCGKTTVLTSRFLRELEGPDRLPLSAIVVLTFTEKAARELRQRIRQRCREELESGEEPAYWRAILRGLQAAPIGTFHEYCGQWLRRHAVEAGIDPDFTILDESVAGAIREEALAKSLRMWLARQDADLIELAAEYGIGRSRQAIADLVSAAPRSALIEWAAWTPEAIVSHWTTIWDQEVLPLLYQPVIKAAQSTWEGLSTHETTNKTMQRRRGFLLEHLPEIARYGQEITKLEEIVQEARVEHGGGASAWESKSVHTLISQSLKSLREEVKDYLAKTTWDHDATLEGAVMGLRLTRLAIGASETYASAKRARAGLDFNDLITMTLELLRAKEQASPLDPTDAESNSSTSLSTIARVLVDEFQDTDPAQSEILTRLTTPGVSEGKLFLVGDFKQSIYRFRGARPQIFQQFRQKFPIEGRHALTENFRSNPSILNFVNALFDATFPEPETALKPRVTWQGSPDQPCPITFVWQAEPETEEEAKIKISMHEKRIREGRRLARLLRERLRQGWLIRDRSTNQARLAHAGDVAFLFRSMTDVTPYESALDEEGFDYHTVGGAAFYTQQEVTDLINVLSVIEDPFDAVALAGVLRSPFFCISDDGLYWLTTHTGDLVAGLEDAPANQNLEENERSKATRARDLLAHWRSFKDREPISSLLNRVLDESGYEAALLGQMLGARKRANVRKLVRLARQFDQQNDLTLAAFVAKLRNDLKRPPREEQAATTDEAGTSVRLMTIHQSKGLEFPIVVLPDLNRKSPGRFNFTAFSPKLGPLVRPSLDSESNLAGAPDGSADGSGATRGASLGWLVHESLEKAEEAAESHRLFYVATTRARDALILSAAATVSDRAASTALKLLDERFNRETGECTASLPLGWEVPRAQVVVESGAAEPGEPRFRRSGRLPLVDTARAIEEEVVEPSPLQAPGLLIRRPELVRLAPDPTDRSSTARLDRLCRIVLADPRFLETADPSHLASKLVQAHDPLLPYRWFDQLVQRLKVWLKGPIAQVLSTGSIIERDLNWSLKWPPHSSDSTLFLGSIDLLIRDQEGLAQAVNVRNAQVDPTRSNLDVQMSLLAAQEMGVGLVTQGWHLVDGQGTRWEPVTECDPDSIDQAIHAYLIEHWKS